MIVRPETEPDREAVFGVNAAAFGRDNEARLVDALRRSHAFVPELSLVAVDRRPSPAGVGDVSGLASSRVAHVSLDPIESSIVGHILFTSIVIRDGSRSHDALALAPLAVLPSHQNRGIGSALVRRGLDDARRLGHRVIIVVGHPAYYPRFGFGQASACGIRAPFEVRKEAFMSLALQPDALRHVQGEVEYPIEFAGV